MAEDQTPDEFKKESILSAINSSIKLNVLELFKQLKETYDKKFDIYNEDIDKLNQFMIKTISWMESHEEQHRRDLTILSIILVGATLVINTVFHMMK